MLFGNKCSIILGPCDIDNGGCKQLCFPTPRGDTASVDTSATCGCAIGYELSNDGKSCTSGEIFFCYLARP